MSLATIYNSLHDFAEVGLLHAIPVPAGPACYDTNTARHNHILIGTETTLHDAPHGTFVFDQADYVAMGLMITSVDVLLRAQRIIKS
jgi:Fur family iron response transcriptional regulator